MDDFLILDSVFRHYGGRAVVDGISLQIQRGEVFSLLGPSGCGKTTLLRMIAGLDLPDSGRILLQGKDLTRTPAHRRPVNTVFQNYALFPHLTVAENIGFGLEAAKRDKSGIAREVTRMLELVRLTGYGKKRPSQLSGGEKQRVAIARALVNQPQVLLLDEPLAALDLKLRQHLLLELRALHAQVDTTFIYVTHDQGEAMSLSHRIAVLHSGKVEQVGTPREIYEHPRTSRVAAFIGDTNFLPVTKAVPGQEFWTVQVPGLGAFQISSPITNPISGKPLKISIRPENLRLWCEMKPPAKLLNSFPATVAETVYFGTHTLCLIDAGGHRLTLPFPLDAPPARKGDSLQLVFDPADALIFESGDPPAPAPV
ncbi:MAG: ABC transporter ATP-binding protein [Verrucomicrobiota bacterium]